MSRNISDPYLPALNTSPEYSFWQSESWREILSKTGQAEVIPYKVGDRSIMIERRKIWRNYSGLFILGIYVDTLSPSILKDIRENIAHSGDLFLQIEPIGGEVLSNKKAPFRRFLEPTTAVLPLTSLTEETLLNHFEEKGRYNIRVALRRGLQAHWVQGNAISTYFLRNQTSNSMTHTELFFELLKETTERDHFSHNSFEYYRDFITVLEKNNAGGLLFVTKENQLHAAGIFVYTHQTGIYYYGASPNDSAVRRDYGTYLLQHAAICEAIYRGCKEYDFLGISSKRGDKLTGVTAFKMRFAPHITPLPPEIVIVYKPLTLFVLRVIAKIRKLLK